MFSLKSLATALLSTAVLGQTPEERAAYPEYTAQFDKHGITWEPIKVKTDDGWTLTIFHITGDAEGPF